MTDDGTDLPHEPAEPEPLEVSSPGFDDTGSPPGEAPATGRSRRPFILGGAVVLAVVVALLVVLVGGSGGGSYTDETEEKFLAACTAGAEADGEDASAVCRCLYEGIVDDIPYDRYESVNDALATGRDADPDADVVLPDDFDGIRASCVEESGLEPITTTTTLAEGQEPLIVPPPTTAPPGTEVPVDTTVS